MPWRNPFIIPMEDMDFVPGTDGNTEGADSRVALIEKMKIEKEKPGGGT